MKSIRLLLLIPLFLTGCAKDFYAQVKPGTFHGKCTLVPVGVDHQNDYPLYLLRQDARDPFRFERYNGEVIQPRTMLTSGGNVPWFIQVGPALDPGTYWDAYVIHDWLFDAHRRRLPEVARYSIGDAAMILAEAQKTMIESGHSRILESQWAYGQGVKIKSSRKPAFRDTFSVYANYVAAQTPFARVPWISHRYEPVPEQYQILGIPLPRLRSSTRVNLHLASTDQRDEAADLANRLQAIGLPASEAPAIDTQKAPSHLEVRFSSATDKDRAAQVAAILDTNPQFGRAVIRATPKASGLGRGHVIDVWYPRAGN